MNIESKNSKEREISLSVKIMTFPEFKESLKDNNPPKEITPLLTAMWLEANGDWNAAHQIAQSVKTTDGSRVHAYLHRVEGDLHNAGYWYFRAERQMPETSLEEEWETIVDHLLKSYS